MEATPHLQQPTAHGKRSGAARRKLRKERQAQLDAQFANLEIDPEKGPKLPAELVYHIMRLSKPPPADFHSKQAQDHRRFLCRLSLVCSLWREEAQKLLWKLVCLRTEQHVEGFLSGGAKMHLTEELAIGGVEEGSDSPMNGELVNEVLARTADLLVLSVNKVVDFDPTALTRANFTRPSTSFKAASFEDPFNLPFQLYKLILNSRAWTEEHFPSALIVALLESTTTEVEIEIFSPANAIGAPRPLNKSPIPRFHPSPQGHPLTSLYFAWDYSQIRTAFLPFLAQLHHLVHLRLDYTDPDVLQAIPSKLAVLSITKTVSTDDLTLENVALRRNYSSLSTLKKWELPGTPRMSPRALEFVKRCQERGIEVVWLEPRPS